MGSESMQKTNFCNEIFSSISFCYHKELSYYSLLSQNAS